MFMAFNVMERKNCSITRRQLRDCFVQRDPVNNRHRIGVFGTFYYLNRCFAIFSCLFQTHSPLAEVHQHLIHRQPVQPGSKSRFAPETTNFSKELDENLLSEVFGFRNIPGHSQAEGILATIEALIKILESPHFSVGCFLRQLIVCRLRCLGFGSGHVFIYRASWEEISQTPDACSARYHAFADFNGEALFLGISAWGCEAR